MDAIKTIADAIRAERKAAEEDAAATGTASAAVIKDAVAAGQGKDEPEPGKAPDESKDPASDKEPDDSKEE